MITLDTYLSAYMEKSVNFYRLFLMSRIIKTWTSFRYFILAVCLLLLIMNWSGKELGQYYTCPVLMHLF